MVRCLRWRSALVLVALGVSLGLLVGAPARADLFLLESGGRVQGEWLNREAKQQADYSIRTACGATVKLARNQVREHLSERPEEAQYQRIAPTFADTVAGQWALAEWCREHNLKTQRTVHLQRIVELDPQHSRARALLGYVFIKGKWGTEQEHRQRDGYQFYRGRWRLPQEIELLEAKAKREVAEKEWLIKLRIWRKALATTDKSRWAQGQFAAIQDPVVVEPLRTMFASEDQRLVKIIYLEILARLTSPEAVELLVEITLADADLEVYFFALDRLVERHPSGITKPFINALRDADNLKVNRAAGALARFGDKSTIPPLIEALVTNHQRLLPGQEDVSPDSTTATFTSNGGASVVKNQGPRIQIAITQNQPVLEALGKLSGGASFGYDQKAWRGWYAQERQAIAAQENQQRASVDPRRGP